MRFPGFIDRRTILRGRRLWLHYGVFWLGAVATGLVAVMYARLIDFGYETFLRITALYWWLPLLLTPAIGAIGVWVTRRFFPGAEGSGIPQVIAMLHDGRELGPRLLTIRILIGKIAVSFLSILGDLPSDGRADHPYRRGAHVQLAPFLSTASAQHARRRAGT